MNDTPKTCFVIQPFDKGKFDKRYSEIYEAAIKAADLHPIRADSVLGTKPIIETIEEELSSCDATLVDISISNENVFLELGYALAMNKPCVIICDEEARKDLPFDIRHRPVIFYNSHSPSSFSTLSRKITSNLKVETEKQSKIKRSSVQTTEGEEVFEDYENSVIGILLTHAPTEPDGVSIHTILREFANLQYTDTTLSVAIQSLKEKEFISEVKLYDDRNDAEFSGYILSDIGMDYVLRNRSAFASKKPPKNSVDDIEEDVPF